jgi:hypothetical protein
MARRETKRTADFRDRHARGGPVQYGTDRSARQQRWLSAARGWTRANESGGATETRLF